MPATDPPDATELESARRRLLDADRATVLTGAGVSAASGVPTFRGEDGLWRDHRPEDLATPRAFEDDPRLVWEWYGWRRRTVADCRPNVAHRALASWTLRREGVRLVTQNVDDLHERALREDAGDRSPPEHARTLELHGSLFRTLCTGCGRRRPHRERIDASGGGTLPRCGECGELLRPDVVWFGESLPRGTLEAAMDAARRASACLVAGTSAAVQPAASVARVAAESGAVLVEVNPERTPLTGLAEHALAGPAEEILPALLDANAGREDVARPGPADPERGSRGADDGPGAG